MKKGCVDLIGTIEKKRVKRLREKVLRVSSVPIVVTLATMSKLVKEDQLKSNYLHMRQLSLGIKETEISPTKDRRKPRKQMRGRTSIRRQNKTVVSNQLKGSLHPKNPNILKKCLLTMLFSL